jgi:hypothetical protein
VLEAALAAAILLALAALAAGAGGVQTLFIAGAAAVALGLAVGVPAGVGYHIALHRALAPLDALDPGWWWRPTRYHARIPAAERRRVMAWFTVGAAGFLVAVTGCALVLVAALAM